MSLVENNKKLLKETLQEEEVYTLARNVRTSKSRQMTVLLLRLNYQWNADVAFMPFVNDGYKTFLLCIDIFSRQPHVCAVNTTNAEQVNKCFNNIFEMAKPSSLRTDGGMEFRAKKVKAFLKDEGVTHYITQSTHQANYAESCIKNINSTLSIRFIKTLSNGWRSCWIKYTRTTIHNILHWVELRPPITTTIKKKPSSNST